MYILYMISPEPDEIYMKSCIFILKKTLVWWAPWISVQLMAHWWAARWSERRWAQRSVLISTTDSMNFLFEAKITLIIFRK